MKALDEMVKRYKREEEELVAKFKEGLDNITKEELQKPSTNVNDLKANIKKKH